MSEEMVWSYLISLFSLGSVKKSGSCFSIHALNIKIILACDCVPWLKIPFTDNKTPC